MMAIRSFNLHRFNSNVRHRSQGFQQVAKDIDDWDVDNSFELSEKLVCNHGPKHGTEVAEHGEGVVDGGAAVMVKVELLVDVNTQDGFHAIVWQSLAKLISEDEKHRLGVWNIVL